MARPRISDIWVTEIAHLLFAAGIDSPSEICRRVEKWGTNHGFAESEIPSDVTIKRYVRRLRNETLERGSEPFNWPDSMGTADHQVPWEGSRASLDLVRHCAENGLPWPTVRIARWYWRVCQASLGTTGSNRSSELQAPFSPSTGDADANREESSVTTKPQDEIMDIRLHRANWLAVGEVLEHQGFDVQSSIRERIELELIFLPERSQEDRLALEITAQSVGAPQPLPPYEFWLDYGDRRVSPSEMIVIGVGWFQKYRQQKLQDGSWS